MNEGLSSAGTRCSGFWLLLLVLGASCTSAYKVVPLIARDAAAHAARPDAPRMPLVFPEEQVSDLVLEELVPFQWCLTARGDWIPMDSSLRSDLKVIISDMPDALSYSEGQARVDGVVSQHVGFGVSTGYSTRSVPYRLTLYREAEAVMPVRCARETGMIVNIRDAAAAVGMQEGDFLVQIAGIDALFKSDDAWAQSPLQALRLSWKPGDSVQVAWIRPGTGRMEGAMKLLPSAKSYRSSPDAIDLKMGEVNMRTKSNGQVVWFFPDSY